MGYFDDSDLWLKLGVRAAGSRDWSKFIPESLCAYRIRLASAEPAFFSSSLYVL